VRQCTLLAWFVGMKEEDMWHARRGHVPDLPRNAGTLEPSQHRKESHPGFTSSALREDLASSSNSLRYDLAIAPHELF